MFKRSNRLNDGIPNIHCTVFR